MTILDRNGNSPSDRNERAREQHKREHAPAPIGSSASEYFAESNAVVRRGELLWFIGWVEGLRRRRTWYRRLWNWARGKSELNLWPWELILLRQAARAQKIAEEQRVAGEQS